MYGACVLEAAPILYKAGGASSCSRRGLQRLQQLPQEWSNPLLHYGRIKYAIC